MTKPTKWHVRPAMAQISLGICPVWSESSLCARWVAKDPSFFHADSDDSDQPGHPDSEDSDQTGRMPRLIWVFAGCTFCWFCPEAAHLILLWLIVFDQKLAVLLYNHLMYISSLKHANITMLTVLLKLLIRHFSIFQFSIPRNIPMLRWCLSVDKAEQGKKPTEKYLSQSIRKNWSHLV